MDKPRRCRPSRIDIIIPAYNAEATLESCLVSVFNLRAELHEVRVTVVDNGSTDKTLEIASRFPCKVLNWPAIKVGAVRNRGGEAAQGDILAFTDSDCVVPCNWLVDSLAHFDDPGVGAVGGGCLAPDCATWIEKAWVAPQKEEVQPARFLPASNFIVRRDLFRSLSGFDEGMVAGEDDDLSKRIRGKGFRLISVKSCYVIHLGYPKTARDIFRRQVWHASDSIATTNALSDRMFLATNLFLLSAVVFLFSLLLRLSPFSITSLSMMILVIAAVSTLKIVRSSDSGGWLAKTVKFFQLFYIYFFFFLGRSVGLVRSYQKGARKKLGIACCPER